MTTELILEKFQHQQPRLIYLSGKTCTGKTTFANELQHHGYKKVELDKIVMESVVTSFGVTPGDGFRTAYRDTGPKEQTAAFITAARAEIIERLKDSPLVIEGAVAKSRILQEIFTAILKDFVFIYFHPVNLEVYMERILSRFVAGTHTNTSALPKDFWALVQEEDLINFKNTRNINKGIKDSVKKYASKSMEESKDRLAHLQEFFNEITVVEV